MQYSLFTVTTFLLACSSLISASPVNQKRQNVISPYYYLKTQVTNSTGDVGTNKSDLYVWSYHTGAGQGIAALSSNRSIGWQGYLNGTQQLMTYPNNNLGPWPFNIQYGPYQLWNVITISIAGLRQDYQGFSLNETGLHYNQSTADGGWLACDWWYGVPQLFQVPGYLTLKPTTACSRVNLIPEYLETPNNNND